MRRERGGGVYMILKKYIDNYRNFKEGPIFILSKLFDRFCMDDISVEPQ